MEPERKECWKITVYIILWMLVVAALFYLILAVNVPLEPKHEGGMMPLLGRLVTLAFAGLLSGCSLAPSDDVLRTLVNSDRSWCLVITTVYGTGRIAGTGIKQGKVICTQEGMTVTSEAVK